MEKSIETQNKDFMIYWIEKNPNFNGINFYNNSIVFRNNVTVNLGNFLISSLLNNQNIKQQINSMEEFLFQKIISANTEVYNYMNSIDNDGEYIINIRLAPTNNAVLITTNKTENKAIKDLKPFDVLRAFNSLSRNPGNNYITIENLYKKLNKTYIPEGKKDIDFFDLINTDRELSLAEINSINDFSHYMYNLMCYQDYLIGDAKKLLELYNHKMVLLLNNEELNDNQKYALKLYNDNLSAYNFKLEKETSHQRKASSGFSSLVLIIISVLVTLSLILLLIIIH